MAKSFSRTKNSVLNLTTGLGGQMVSTIMKFIVRTVFIHALGKSYLGINSLFSDILTMLSLTELGFATAINYRLYKPIANGDAKRVRVLMKFYKQAYRVIGCVILGIGICFIPALPVIIRDYDTLTALKINATVIFLLHILRTVSSYWFFAYRSAIMRANQKKYILDQIDMIGTILNSIAKILVLIFLKDFVIYTASVIVFTILQNTVKAFITKHNYPQFFEKEEDSVSRQEIRDMFKDCMALFAYKVNVVILKATDNMVISSFIGLTAVGVYSNYLLFYTTVKSLLGKFYTAIHASMGNLFATEEIPTRYRFFEVINYLTVVLYGTAGVGIAVCADELIRVWVGMDYVVAQPFAILIGIETLFQGLQLNLGQVRNVSGVFRQMWFRPILGIILNLVVSIVLVRFIGLYGVIIGTIASLLLTNFMVDPHLIHKYSFDNYRPVSEYYKRNLLYFLLLAAICAADLFICTHVFTGFGWFSVIVHALIVAVTVPGLFILLFWKTHECQYLRKLALRMLGKVRKKLAK